MGAEPIEPIIKPKIHAVIPLIKFSPVKAPTIRRARIISKNCSPNPKAIIIGMA